MPSNATAWAQALPLNGQAPRICRRAPPPDRRLFMARPKPSDPNASSTDNGDVPMRGQQELYGRREPPDLDEGRIGRDDETDVENPNPGRGTDASGRPSTARSGANTQ
jgi:hypothetical protein